MHTIQCTTKTLQLFKAYISKWNKTIRKEENINSVVIMSINFFFQNTEQICKTKTAAILVSNKKYTFPGRLLLRVLINLGLYFYF